MTAGRSPRQIVYFRFAPHGFFPAQGFFFAAQGFLAAQGFAFAAHGFVPAQGFFLPAQGLAALAAQGLLLCAKAGIEPAATSPPTATAEPRTRRDFLRVVIFYLSSECDR